MRSFVLAVIVAIVLAIGFAVVLSSFQKTAEMEFKTEGVRVQLFIDGRAVRSAMGAAVFTLQLNRELEVSSWPDADLLQNPLYVSCMEVSGLSADQVRRDWITDSNLN